MKRIWLAVFIITIIIFILLDLFLVSGEGHGVFPWSHIAGSFALLGLLGCLGLIAFAKLLGHYWLQRKEDYYDRNDNDE